MGFTFWKINTKNNDEETDDFVLLITTMLFSASTMATGLATCDSGPEKNWQPIRTFPTICGFTLAGRRLPKIIAET